jgi:hypothetical protein
MSLAWRGLPFGPALRQPDQRSCGPSCLVVARMVLEPAYAEEVRPRFDAEVLATHRGATGVRDARGAIQVPWPRALGTPPWAVAREMSGITGTPCGWRLARWGREAAYERVVAGVSGGHPVPVYVGSRWLPRHVVLALEADAEAIEVYDPARGTPRTVARAAFERGEMGVGSWNQPWFVVGPG